MIPLFTTSSVAALLMRRRVAAVAPPDILPDPQATDPDNLWNDVALLLSAEGRRVAEPAWGNVADSDVVTVRAAERPVVTHEQSPFVGGQSFQFAEAGSLVSALRVLRSPFGDFLNGPFTLEGFARSEAWEQDSASYNTICAFWIEPDNLSFEFRNDAAVAPRLEFRYRDPFDFETLTLDCGPVPSTDSWFYWCIERNSSNLLRIYINGTMVASEVVDIFVDSGTPYYTIGASGDGTVHGFFGQMTEMRLTKSARYNSDAGHTVPTARHNVGIEGGGDVFWNFVSFLSADNSPADGYVTSGRGDPQLDREGTYLGSFGGGTFQSLNAYGTRSGSWVFTGDNQIRGTPFYQGDRFDLSDRATSCAIELRIRPDATALIGEKFLLGYYRTEDDNRQWAVLLNNGVPEVRLSTDGINDVVLTAAAALAVDTWAYLALTRDALGDYRFFVDGVLADKSEALRGIDLASITPNTIPLDIACGGSLLNNSHTGLMSYVRITIGAARYDADDPFTPPEKMYAYVEPTPVVLPPPETEDVYWENVILRMTYDDGEFEFIDYSRQRNTFTVSTTAIKNDVGGKFDGRLTAETGEVTGCLDCDDPSGVLLSGTDDFTVEFWAHANNNVPSVLTYLMGGPWGLLNTSDRNWRLYVNENGRLSWGQRDEDSTTITTVIADRAIPSNEWFHIAVDRTGGILRIYQNGVMVAKQSSILNIYPSLGFRIGQDTESWFGVAGRGLDDSRITKGVARYASDAGFSVPVSPHYVEPIVEGVLNVTEETDTAAISGSAGLAPVNITPQTIYVIQE